MRELRWGIISAVVVFLVTCCIAFGKGRSPETVRHLASINLSGTGGYVDYLIMAPGGPLYAGYASKNALVVIDPGKRKAIKTVAGLKDVRSIALVPELNRGFTSNRGDDTVGVIDLKSSRLLRRIKNGKGPDAILYDQAAHLVYVANHEGRSATLIDPATDAIRAVIPLGGLAEYAQADPVTGLVYQNLEDKNEIAVVDPQKMAVVARYKTAPGTEPTGLALDADKHRLFCACGNEKLIVMDADSGKVIVALPIGSGADSVAFDSGLRRIYTANGESGTMTVIRERAADDYVVEEHVPTHKGAHALAVDAVTHRVYVVHGNMVEVYEAVNELGSAQKGELKKQNP